MQRLSRVAGQLLPAGPLVMSGEQEHAGDPEAVVPNIRSAGELSVVVC